jgi:hypothetical protein
VLHAGSRSAEHMARRFAREERSSVGAGSYVIRSNRRDLGRAFQFDQPPTTAWGTDSLWRRGLRKRSGRAAGPSRGDHLAKPSLDDRMPNPRTDRSLARRTTPRGGRRNLRPQRRRDHPGGS